MESRELYSCKWMARAIFHYKPFGALQYLNLYSTLLDKSRFKDMYLVCTYDGHDLLDYTTFKHEFDTVVAMAKKYKMKIKSMIIQKGFFKVGGDDD